MPVLLLVAIGGSRVGFVIVVTVTLLTDALDGFLARCLNAYSELGRKLDSVADYLMMICGLSGIALLWPAIVRRELPWIAVGLSAFFSVIVYGFARLGRAPCYHTWASKILAIGSAVSLIPLLAGNTAAPFHVAMSVQVLVALEEMSIAILVPWHVGEIPTVWHAARARRAAIRATAETQSIAADSCR